MLSGKPPPDGKDLPTTLTKHRENFQFWVDLVEKGLSHEILTKFVFFNAVSR